MHTLYDRAMSSRAIDTSSRSYSQQVPAWSKPGWKSRHPGVHPGTAGWTQLAIQIRRTEHSDNGVLGFHSQAPAFSNYPILTPHQPSATPRIETVWVPIYSIRSPWHRTSQLFVLCDCNRMDTPVRFRTGKGHLHGQSLGRRMGPPAEAGPPTRLLSNGLGSGSQP